ncbi:MAG TPA: SDR family NAD(P)-dependent oxidoreductase, partial [Chloroflexota bacterium]|nr:SDR family NAD(P)-dependent oxidoreductase [Chloroflexota bacterium]
MTRDQGQLSDKVVVVIGGARGIGRGIVERCAAEGARLVIADLNQERDNVALALGGPAVALPLDARVAEDHERMAAEIMARFGRIDVLVYYAGIFPRATLLETDESLWHAVLDTNLTGSFLPYPPAFNLSLTHGVALRWYTCACPWWVRGGNKVRRREGSSHAR